MKFPLCVLALLLGNAVVQAAPIAKPLSKKDGLETLITPTSTRSHNAIIDLRSGSPSIKVVLHNTSYNPISVYEEWNSWGFYNITLEITKVDGKVLHKPLLVRKGTMNWYRNFASTQSIKPKGLIVRVVRFHIPSKQNRRVPPSGWLYQGFPLPPKGGTRKVTMRAVFQNPDPVGEAMSSGQKKFPVWKGKIASPFREYIFRWKTN